MLSIRSYVFIGLNAVRVLSIIGLLLVFSSSIFVIVKDIEAVNTFQDAKRSGNVTHVELMTDCEYIHGSTVPNQAAGVFWAVVSRLLIIFQVIVIICSELDLFGKFFDRYFPVLGPSFGLGALGIFQCLIGATILSHHVDDFTLVSAFFLFSIGCVNILLGLIFRESAKTKRSIWYWRDEAKGFASSARDMQVKFVGPTSTFANNTFLGRGSMEKRTMPGEFGGRSSPSDLSSSDEKYGYGVGLGFGRQAEHAAGLKGFLISKPLETLPRYTPSPHPPSTRSVRPPSIIVTQSPPPTAMVGSVPSPQRSRFSEPSRYSQPSPSRYSHASDEPEVPPMPVPTFKSSGTAL